MKLIRDEFIKVEKVLNRLDLNFYERRNLLAYRNDLLTRSLKDEYILIKRYDLI